MKHLLLLLMGGGILCSCTITKRHFGNGYHVEWNRKIKTTPHSPESSNMESPEAHFALKGADTLIIHQTESAEEVVAETKNAIETKAVIEDQDQLVDEPSFQFEDEIQKEQPIKTGESSLVKQTDDEEEEAPKRIMHPLMWGIWGMWSIAIACMFFVTFYAEFLIGVGLGFFIAMIFAIIVLRGLRKHREKYRFRGLSYPFAILSIVFGAIATLGVLIFLFGGIAVGPGG
jgi:hypothetical protein